MGEPRARRPPPAGRRAPPASVIRLVTFDFWQTLFADTGESLARAHALRLRGVREALAAAGHAYDPGELARADVRAADAFQAVWREHRDMTAAEQVGRFLAALDPALPDRLAPAARERVALAYQAPALTHRPVVTADAPEALAALRARGLILGVISNTGRTPGWVLRRLLEDAGLLPGLAVLSFSDEAGVRKPAAAMFRRTLARTGIPPEAAVHVGDDAVADVAGARGVGMRAVHYAPSAAAAPAGADAVLRHFAELPALLARLR
jgi:putative hydrolase of the HAD superfamily